LSHSQSGPARLSPEQEKKMFKKFLGLTLVFLAVPAMAGDLSYNFVQAGYGWLTLDDDFVGDIDGDGFNINGSVEVGENWYIFAGYSSSDFDFGIDFDELGVGVGFHAPINASADFFATVSYISAEVSLSGFGSADEDGYGVSVGLRGMATDKVELSGAIAYADLGDGADGTSFGGSALYNFTDMFAAGVEVGFDEDVTAYGIIGRVYFGK
jgi:hypothetical protein